MSYWTADPRTLGLPIFSKPLHPLSLAAPSQTLYPIDATRWAQTWPILGKILKAIVKSQLLQSSSESDEAIFGSEKSLSFQESIWAEMFEVILKASEFVLRPRYGLHKSIRARPPVRERESRGQDKWVCLMMTWHIPCQPEIDFAAAAAPSLKTALKLRPQRCVTWVLWLQLRWLSI